MPSPIVRRCLFSTAGLVVATALLTAQAPTKPPQSSAHPEDQHLDMDLVDASREQCAIATTALEQLSMELDSARNATDLATAKATLETSRKTLREVTQHLGSCGDIMRMLAYSPGHPRKKTPSSSGEDSATPK